MLDKLKENNELWDLFTKSEEYEPILTDKYDRFPYYLSRHRQIFEPLVSAFLLKNGLCPIYPQNKKFAVCLTHDFDSIHFPIISISKEACTAFINGQFTEFLSLVGKNSSRFIISRFNKKANPQRNFEQIMEMENRYGAKSSFYILLANKHSGFEGCHINGMGSELRNIVKSGWEVGLHGNSESYIDLDFVKADKQKLEDVLGKQVIGYRNHYLRFRLPKTWEVLEEAGFKYDSTLGYADCIGFRNGMCHPFRPFHLVSGHQMGIWEIPLVVMDGTLEGYMYLDMDKAWKLLMKLIDIVEAHEGVLTILWHNLSMSGKLGELYQKILEYSYAKRAWMTSGQEIWANAVETGLDKHLL
jgi:peptidoglycan/xylan/chitin deacetylase (PgdA/CDA1 family)